MQFPKLTPLQSRLAACLGTSILLLVIWLSLNPRHFAYAAELDSIHNADHNHHRILAETLDLDWGPLASDIDSSGSEDGDHVLVGYEAAFSLGLDQGIIGKRQALDTVRLKNNLPNTLNIVPGETQYYVFQQSELSSASGSRGRILPTNVTGQDAAIFGKRKVKRDAEALEELEEQYAGDELPVVKRQTTARTLYLSANTCLQPLLNENATGTPGQPTVYVSLNGNNQKPSADSNDLFVQLEQGYAALELPDVTDDIWISISAPTLPNDTFTGPWSYQIAASTDDYYHYYNNDTAFMWTVDTDSTSALLATYNLTGPDGNDTATIAERQAWMDMTSSPPFDIYVFNSSSPKIDGIKQSYCGLSKLNMDFMRINSSISDRGVGSNPKQQFYMQSLLAGNQYFSVLAYKGANTTEGADNSATVGGGGQVWKSMQFSTKADNNCRVIFDLPFCDSVAYAVPTNPQNETLANISTLTSIYDDYARNLYDNFAKSLQQIPCNTTSTAQYSLTSTCNDCARDYKTWLCAVTIPRCVDFSSTEPFLAPRNVGSAFPNGTMPTLDQLPGGLNLQIENTTQLPANSSRNPLIDSDIAPGPYKELLPCQQLCWDMVKSCPMSMGLRCPEPNALYGPLSKSYGTFDPARIGGADGILNISGLSCNYLGVDWPTLGNDAVGLRASWAVWAVAAIAVAFGSL